MSLQGIIKVPSSSVHLSRISKTFSAPIQNSPEAVNISYTYQDPQSRGSVPSNTLALQKRILRKDADKSQRYEPDSNLHPPYTASLNCSNTGIG
jgi:hypothetical protein